MQNMLSKLVELLQLQNSSKHENCNMKFPLNLFSDQIIISQISFENL